MAEGPIAPDLNLNWPAPPSALFLGLREVHVWGTILNSGPDRLGRYASILSEDEKKRAARFRFERDQNRFTVARGFLRTVLGRYLKMDPAEITFSYSDRGKPALNAPSSNPLHFNLSHSHDLALLAVTEICPVGVDVEQIRTLRDADAIADRFFSERESSALRALPPEQKPIGFFNLWTRKEAWLKATGEGISDSLDKVEVSLHPHEPAKFLGLFGKAETAAGWTLVDLAPGTGYKGALALEANDINLKCWAEGILAGK
ncbi:4'-phosphopantetheinyl transferase family protein [Pedosphaera parvula]|uniref:4'-phosphopantetheinyl transferase n=1 Tax=Pedosphaera parvula (strain Ellin514) TaxID=320771 RepID=B9XT00_PEDPL|nr:4'-phosphopantetheinyl transferase superfamily protein [Pedosphaera parvula]EEF57035.1 4'-phosphopantetheinyl transferase [Pedosphaera parvula Ellin514]